MECHSVKSLWGTYRKCLVTAQDGRPRRSGRRHFGKGLHADLRIFYSDAMPELPLGTRADLLGRRIAQARIQAGLTQAQLAGAEFTRAYVSSIEAGRRPPTGRAAHSFASHLGMDIEDLCFGYEAGGHRVLLHDLARARVDVSGGHADRAEAEYLRIAGIAERAGDVQTMARALCGTGLIARQRGEQADAERIMTSVMDLLESRPLADRLEALIGRIGAVFAMGRIEDALRLTEENLARALAEHPASPDAVFALRASSVLLLVERGNVPRALDAADQALSCAAEVSDMEILARGYYHVSRVLIDAGRFDEADRILSLGQTLNDHLGLRTEAGTCLFARGFLLSRQGRLPQAETTLRRAWDALADIGAANRQVNAGAELARVLHGLDRVDEAAVILAECRRVAGPQPDAGQAAELDFIEGRLAHARHDVRTAEAQLRRAVEAYARMGAAMEAASASLVLGDVLAEDGRIGEAAGAYRRGLVVGTASGAAVEERAEPEEFRSDGD